MGTLAAPPSLGRTVVLCCDAAAGTADTVSAASMVDAVSAASVTAVHFGRRRAGMISLSRCMPSQSSGEVCRRLSTTGLKPTLSAQCRSEDIVGSFASARVVRTDPSLHLQGRRSSHPSSIVNPTRQVFRSKTVVKTAHEEFVVQRTVSPAGDSSESCRARRRKNRAQGGCRRVGCDNVASCFITRRRSTARTTSRRCRDAYVASSARE